VAEIRFTVGTDTDKAITDLEKYFDAVSKGSAKVADVLEKNLAKKMTQEFQIKMQGGKLVKEEIGSLGKQADRFSAAQSALNGELGKTASALRRQLEALKAVRDTTKKYQDNTKKLNKDWVQVNETIDKVAKNLKDINKTELGVGGEGLVARLTKANLLANALQGAFNRLASGISNAIQTGLEFEVLNLSLEAFAGSAEAAEGAMISFQQTAIKTPLNLEQVAKGGQVLLAFGLNASEAAEAVDKLAIIAGATGSDLNNLSRNLGQIQSQGRAFTRDLNQFAVAGIPIFQELAKVMGVSVAEVRALATEGSVGFKEVSEAITNMTREGSAFNEIGERMQQTWIGKLEKLASDFQLLAGEVAKNSKAIDAAFGSPVQNTLNIFSAIVRTVSNNIEGITNTLKVLGPVIVTILGYLTFLNLGNIVAGIGAIIGQLGLLIAALAKTAVGLTVVNALMGPYGWANILIAGATATAVGIKAFQNLNSEMKEFKLTAQEANEQLRIINGELEATEMTSYGKSLNATRANLEKYANEMERLKNIIKQKNEQGMNAAAEKKALENAELLYNSALEKQAEILDRIEKAQGKNAKQIQQDLLNQQNQIQALNTDLLEQVRKRDELKKTYDEEKKKLSELKQLASDYYRKQISDINDLISNQKQRIQDEKASYQTAMNAVKNRYDAEKRQLDEIYDKAIRNNNAQIQALQARTPAEQKLYDMEKESLKERLKSKDLTEKETLELEAKLERMNRQEKIEKLQARNQELSIEKAERERRLAEERRIEEERLAKLRDENLQKLTTVLDRLNEKLGGIEQDQEDFNTAIKNSEEPLRQQLTNLGLVKNAVFEQIGVIELAQDSYEVAAGKVEIIEDALFNATQQAEGLIIKLGEAIALNNELNKKKAKEEGDPLNKEANLKAISKEAEKVTKPGNIFIPFGETLSYLERAVQKFLTPPAPRFAGGPVSGGSAYTVNELGKEAFLSAAGKLSMINAPSFGKWRAPSSGTIIPAHLTKKLDIPTGGIDLNINAGQASRRVGPSPMMGLLARLQGSDNIQNNVTVQSMNPTKTASDMLVQLTKLRRRRMY
jgi:tape measure domain-containing protein